MDKETQRQEVKRSKSKPKTAAKCASVRIYVTGKKRASQILDEANDKEYGRSVKFPELFELAISLVTPEHIRMLQERSATNEDRKEHLRQIYIANFGSISKDEFTGFMLTPAFPDFLAEQNREIAVTSVAG